MTASADVLWDQSNVDAAVNAIVDQEFGDFPDYSSYMVDDVTVGGPGWNITKITVYFTDNPAWVGNHMGRLNIFDNPGGFPAEPGNSGEMVDVTIGYGAYGLEVVANVDIDLAPGNYYIGLTPILDFGTYGQAFHQAAPIQGTNTLWQNPGGAFGYGTDWTYAYVLDSTFVWQDNYDMAILIEGTAVPAPGALALLGLAGLVGRRRR
ncbi:MAG: hypothetical protein JSV91_00905 [Phycisphaerales bacterium]|nr:MAG: hypothetical protein JSV91_00905 [Phycisphaerales bacterium]